MELVAQTLETEFKNVAHDLQFVSHKIESELKQQYAGTASPADVLSRIKRLQEEWQQLRETFDAVSSSKHSLMTTLKSVILQSSLQLDAMQGRRHGDTTVLADEAERTLTVWEALGSHSASAPEDVNSLLHVPNAITCDTKSDKENIAPTQHLKGKGTEDEWAPISDQEFEQVPLLIKGRVKLVEINRLYESIWKHFKANKISKPLTIIDLTNMGNKVTGQTGEAKLNSLRHLKRITINKIGIELTKPVRTVQNRR
eukprot:GILK01010099.1.p1 GENE.GILK01010099.1~~GILK01010099.1.p1  ORF type:complete len:270 (-),score=38.28 GILK01010099.1:97-864(-)